MKINVIGGGIFGVTAALELQNRGHQVAVFEKGTLPEPKASSTDISKMIRADYGADELYTNMMVEAFEGWHRWNRIFSRPRYHEVGFLLLTREPPLSGTFEAESIRMLSQKGFPLVHLDEKILSGRFPLWNREIYRGGYFNPKAGWAESSAIVSELVTLGKKEGVQFIENEGLESFIFKNEEVAGFQSNTGNKHLADLTILTAGTWSQHLLPDLKTLIKTIGQPVFHLLPENSRLFSAETFPGWAADISKTGWYGFPAQPNGIVKIANHGVGFE
ncbi:MAG TPA: FAD-dependent oxidoreductase, partial [Saprospiraceae bacterium]|nr:FAD-dependent oxidoreductase [Saprospiraceae bacterium]